MAAGSAERTHGGRRLRTTEGPHPPRNASSKPKLTKGAWEEARAIIWAHRKRLGIGLALILRGGGKWSVDGAICRTLDEPPPIRLRYRAEVQIPQRTTN